MINEESVGYQTCSTYISAGAKLLQRAAPPGYRDQQTAQLATEGRSQSPSQLLSVLIFRLGPEWLALPTKLCQQILAPVSAHILPHRSNATLLGIVNVRGQLLLKVSLLNILGLGASPSTAQPKDLKGYPRMVVIEKSTETGGIDTWAFDVNELYGIHSVAFDQLEPIAVGVSAAVEVCARYVFSWHERPVNFLDDARLGASKCCGRGVLSGF